MFEKIYTIGFTKRNAKDFFSTLKNNDIDILLDVRLNNKSQLAGYSKYPDIKYFLRECSNVEYIHEPLFAPSKEILSDYRKKQIDWSEYEIQFHKLLQARNVHRIISKYFDMDYKKICLLCSEYSADKCHRRLVAEEFHKIRNIEVIHL